ncbi:MAG: FAD:protein FMN transferase [Actinomycetota bacterium]|nr:FAD:protein FMN transferase [Actinomycetota bacterium]
MSSVGKFSAMGCEVVVGGAEEAEMRAIRALFERREQVFSRFRPDSELNRVNRSAAPIVAVSGLFAETLADALHVLRKVLPRRIWRGAHYLNFAVWALATTHGITAGTDNTAAWLLAIYVIAIATVGGLACWRFAEPASAGAPGIPTPKPVTRTATDSAS